MSTLPPLPKIDGNIDLMLDVYTHSSLRPTDATTEMNDTYGDIQRLEELGTKILDLAITLHFYNERPSLNTAEDIRFKTTQFTSFAMVDSWLNAYGLKEKLRILPSEKDAALNDPVGMIKFFRIYVAAAYVCNGQDIVQNWISRLIDPTADVTSSIPLRAGGGHAQPESSQPQSLVGPTSVTLALVNQTASQKRIQVTYPATQAGMSHTPTWTVRCCMDGEEKGIGIGKSQKVAKEEAAKQAWVAMGWGN